MPLRVRPSKAKIMCPYCMVVGHVTTKDIARRRPAALRTVGMFAVTGIPIGVKRKHAPFTELSCGNCGMEWRVQR